MTDTKICPYCAEEIKTAAIKCRYCHSDLTGAVPEPPHPPAAHPRRSADDGDVVSRPAVGGLPGFGGLARFGRLPRFEGLARPRLAIALTVVAVLLLVAVGYLGWVVHRMNGAEEARTSGEVAAVAHVETILSYDHASFDKGTAQAERVMTPTFRKEYADTVRLVRKDALSTASTVKAQVVASSVVDATADRVDALLFVNQSTTGTELKTPRVDLNRVVVTLVRDDDGGWLVDGLKAL